MLGRILFLLYISVANLWNIFHNPKIIFANHILDFCKFFLWFDINLSRPFLALFQKENKQLCLGRQNLFRRTLAHTPKLNINQPTGHTHAKKKTSHATHPPPGTARHPPTPPRPLLSFLPAAAASLFGLPVLLCLVCCCRPRSPAPDQAARPPLPLQIPRPPPVIVLLRFPNIGFVESQEELSSQAELQPQHVASPPAATPLRDRGPHALPQAL
jgi:hypothetical protein